jgi:prolyl-tRNA synthetase
MRWSQLHIPTLRADPADAGVPSHRLLLRAGYVRPTAAGHQALLPLAVRVRARIVAVIREELERIGAQEFALTGAHAEVVRTLAAELRSYRDLPQLWYQLRTASREEARPRAGLLGAREFTMTDSYSLDLTPDGLDRSYRLHRSAYARVFDRLGIPALPVEGGSGSTGFSCPSDAGEDLVVRCPGCGYAADAHVAAAAVAPVADAAGPPAPEPFDTPGVRTIDDLATGFGAAGDRQIKTLVFVLDGKPALVLLRGDHALNERKLAHASGAATLRPATADEIRDALGASPGSLGAVGAGPVPVLADEALRGRRDMFTGANRDGVHLRGVDVARDIDVSSWAELREVGAGEPCVHCGASLSVLRAIEVARLVSLGDALGATVPDAEGGRSPILMGSYGIDVERAMAAIVECHHDEHGIVWPPAVAPFAVAVVVAQASDPGTVAAAEDIYGALRAAGVDTVLDDRAERAGVKFRDVELVGIPVRVTVGTRGLAEGVVEVTSRASGETRRVPPGDVVASVSG